MDVRRTGIRSDQLATVLLISLCIGVYGSLRPADEIAKLAEAPQSVYLVSPAPVPVLLAQDMPTISASSAAVVDKESGASLFAKNAQAVYLPASTTKLMTALVVRESMQLDDVITVPEIGLIDGSKIGLRPGQQFTVHSLLKAMLIHSANDAAEVLSSQYPGGTSAFVVRMNIRAQELHLRQTIFENPTGFDGTHHQTTSADLAQLSREVVKDPVLQEIVKTKSEYITDVSRKLSFFITNTHQLVGTDPTITGIKTGTTDGAGQVLITQVERPAHTFEVVVMGSGDRYQDTRRLIEWVDSAYQWYSTQDLLTEHAILEDSQ